MPLHTLIALRSHYGFGSFFCIPGKQGAHEKGGVEGEIGRFRRHHLVPVPPVASLAALNQRIAAAGILDDGRVITGRPVTVAAAFAAEQPAMMALPDEMFDPARLLTARADNRARICVRQNYYSVPARYAGRRVAVRLPAMSVQVPDGPRIVAAHERAAGKHAEVLTLDHYLEVLKYKPGAMPGATALAQARAAGAFTVRHQQYWDAARRARGDADGTRSLTEVLLGHRALPAAALIQALDRAVTSGALDPQAVLIDARRLAAGPVAAVIPIGALARYDRPAPALAATPAAHQEHPMTGISDTAAAVPFRRALRPPRPAPARRARLRSARSRGAELLFQIITEREERASIAIGTNLPFSEWGTVFPDPRLVAAIVDRVTFNAHILETGTQSYRLATSKTRSRKPAS